MKLTWKNLNLLDENLVKFLNQKYPPLEYTQELDSDEFLLDSVFRGGQREVIHTIQHIIDLQNKEKRNG